MKHGEPEGPLVDFFLSANAQYKKGERIPISVNDYKYEAIVGQRNKLPLEVVNVLKNARSKTEVPDLARYDPTRMGMPRKQEDFFNPETAPVYQSEWDIEVLSEK